MSTFLFDRIVFGPVKSRRLGAVSYTHLDVYKRQTYPQIGQSLPDQSLRKSLSEKSGNDNKNGEYIDGAIICLLYTSRCV